MVLGVVVHETRRGAERPGAFADRLAQRPQPRGVEVGVPDRADPVRAPRWAHLVRGVEDGLRRPVAGGDVAEIEGLRRVEQRGAQRGAGRVGRVERDQRVQEDPEVVPEGAQGRVDEAQLGGGEPELARPARVGVEERPGRRPERRPRVRGRLDEELDRLAARRGVGHPTLDVVRGETLERLAVAPHQRLGAEAGGARAADLEPQRHRLAPPGVGDAAAQAEPGGVPAGPEAAAELEPLVGGGERGFDRDRLPRDVMRRDLVERRDRAGQRRLDELVQHPEQMAVADRIGAEHGRERRRGDRRAPRPRPGPLVPGLTWCGGGACTMLCPWGAPAGAAGEAQGGTP